MTRITQQTEVPETKTTVESANQEYWLANEGLTSELRFHDRVSYLVRSIAENYRGNKLAEVCSYLKRLMWVEDWLEEEAFLSAYESGIVAAQIYLAHSCSDRYLLDEAYELIEGCRDVLLGKKGRRASQNLTFRPDSECWYRIYEALAGLKWKGPESMRNRALTPEAIIDQYSAVEKRCLTFLERNPVKDDARTKQVKRDLGYCMMQVIKMSIRWCPDSQPQLVKQFNALQGPILSEKTGHFLAGKTPNADNPWYWDHELFKWCVLGPATEDEAILCHQWRLDSMRQSGAPDSNLQSYKLGAGVELDQLLKLSSASDLAHAC